jgi:ParB-like chromosome segregation protein Spo0J
MELKDLKDADYNPRVISDRQLKNLGRSLARYADLSGIVFNKRTKTLISGHQRVRTIREAGFKTKIVTKPIKDDYGTVEEGYLAVKTDDGVVRIPLRVVDWKDKKAEKAANIAANAHGGDFDKAKLSVLLEELAKDKKFDVDLIGLDPLTVRTLMPKLPDVESSGSSGGKDSFTEYDGSSFEFECECPKCGYKF